MTECRHANTDWLRALAILMVVVHHVSQNVVVFPSEVSSYFKLGSFGVDLFFVLSGWLIGGLYWRERSKFGNVQLIRFWLRRWLRTLPPYLLFLPIAYASVYFYRQEAFDSSYLVFLQNYREKMPFFLVSWSLAVEEHFYLILPILLGLIAALKISFVYTLVVLVLLSSSARFIDPSAIPSSSFGYAQTASHLHFTGLLLGVLMARIEIANIKVWQSLKQKAAPLVWVSLMLFLLLPFLGEELRYYWERNVAILFFASLLLLSQTKSQFWLSGTRFVNQLALGSYSIYLSHALLINLYGIIVARLHLNYLLWSPVLLFSIFVIGWLFYCYIERTTIVLRDKLVPRR